MTTASHGRIRTARPIVGGVETSTSGGNVRQQLQDALVSAMRSHDGTAMAALRSALGAIANAEAVERGVDAPTGAGPIAHAVSGLGAGDVARRVLTELDVVAIVRSEVAEREAAALSYDRLGRTADADRLRSEANALRAQLK
jgi:uncharacterized protein YqeY